MRYLILLLLLFCSCSVNETGTVSVQTCPECLGAYDGFSQCAFFESDWPKESFLLDDENYHGVGIPIAVRGYMHHKFCFNDTHAVFGSANPTDTGLGLNSNLVVHVESAQMAENFRIEYEYLTGRHSGKHTKSWTFNNHSVTQLFCPRDACEEHIVEELRTAQHSIVFLTFSFTSDAIAQALVALHDQRVCVSGVFENRGAGADYSAYAKLRDAGVGAVRVQTPGVMHHKAFLIDNETAIVGSYNPSSNANTNNAETVVIISEPAVVGAISQEFSRLAGSFPCSGKEPAHSE